MLTISAQARRELIKVIRVRYLASSVSQKRRILDGFVALTGYHRKHAIRMLRSQPLVPASRSPRPPVYGEAIRDALVVLWQASGRSCGKRLKALLPSLLPVLERDGKLSVDRSVRSRLLSVSAATIDRLLANQRAAAQGHRRKRRARRPAPQRAPVRTFTDLLASLARDEAMRSELRMVLAALDPPRRRTKRRATPQPLTANDEARRAAPPRATDQGRPARGLEAPARRGAAKPPRHWRTRADPFDDVWPQVVTWLEAEPDHAATQLLQRLRDEGLGEFPDRQLRTLQRRINVWRRTLPPDSSP